MDDSASNCSFCLRAASFGPFDGIRVCARCSKELGRLITQEDAASLWPARDQRVAEWQASQILTAEDEARVERACAELKATIAESIKDDDGRAHADLAIAFGEMGLSEDARKEASLVLAAGKPDEATREMLQLILTPPLLRVEALTELKAKMKRQRDRN